jgi:hypothetical protein
MFWKEAVVIYFMVMVLNFPGESEENYEKPQYGFLKIELRF